MGYLSDSTAIAEEGGDKSVPTSVIQSVPKTDTEKEEAENLEEKTESDNNLASEVTEAADLLQEQTPKEASCTVADLIDEEEEENSKEEQEEETPLEQEKKEIVEEKVEEKEEKKEEEKVKEKEEEKVEEPGKEEAEEDEDMKEEDNK